MAMLDHLIIPSRMTEKRRRSYWPTSSSSSLTGLMSLSPYATCRGALHVLAEVTRRPAEGALNSLGYWFITPVKHLVEQIEDEVDDAIV